MLVEMLYGGAWDSADRRARGRRQRVVVGEACCQDSGRCLGILYSSNITLSLFEVFETSTLNSDAKTAVAVLAKPSSTLNPNTESKQLLCQDSDRFLGVENMTSRQLCIPGSRSAKSIFASPRPHLLLVSKEL